MSLQFDPYNPPYLVFDPQDFDNYWKSFQPKDGLLILQPSKHPTKMAKQSLKAIKAQCINEIAKKYKREIERLQKENGELKLLLAKYRNEISKLQHSLESERNHQSTSKRNHNYEHS